jgi:hypothetical protein
MEEQTCDIITPKACAKKNEITQKKRKIEK